MIPGQSRECLDVGCGPNWEHTWEYLGILGNILGNTWEYLGIFENTWKYLRILGNTGKYEETGAMFTHVLFTFENIYQRDISVILFL
jgi:hypothetical protein